MAIEMNMSARTPAPAVEAYGWIRRVVGQFEGEALWSPENGTRSRLEALILVVTIEWYFSKEYRDDGSAPLLVENLPLDLTENRGVLALSVDAGRQAMYKALMDVHYPDAKIV